MDFSVRTDLACESMGKKPFAALRDACKEERIGGVLIHRMRVDTKELSEHTAKPMGQYITLECGRLHELEGESLHLLTELLAGELRGMSQRLSRKPVDAEFSILVAGLGNAELTADAIGPKTVGMRTATRHLRE